MSEFAYTFTYTPTLTPRRAPVYVALLRASALISNESLLTQSIKPALHDLFQDRVWPLQPIDLIAEN